MAWLILCIAGLLEIGWTMGLKLSDGFTKLVPTILTLALAMFSIYLVSLSARSIPVGTAYAVWAGVGAVGTVIFGIIIFAEPVSIARFACVGLIVAGIIGLKLVDGSA
ncbi:multidrug efflux SMR transporter [Aliishimia ponticola]|uniref:Guanidinium exporter n=1 Tax=Aliishimia ponticola TaxID=2499833 RepID=A0A4S4NHM7_9RHOB|nr:multidrug efflux SMR transporter [Aliishimia ponticola]THH38177.1 multidrug efflux SMR transporter [Aliishimia ponticola]